MLKHKGTYETISPEEIGHKRTTRIGIVLGKLRYAKYFFLKYAYVRKSMTINIRGRWIGFSTILFHKFVFDFLKLKFNWKYCFVLCLWCRNWNKRNTLEDELNNEYMNFENFLQFFCKTQTFKTSLKSFSSRKMWEKKKKCKHKNTSCILFTQNELCQLFLQP